MVDFGTGGHIRIRWSSLPSAKIAIIIPFYGRIRELANCARSILDRTAFREFQLILVGGRTQPSWIGGLEPRITQSPRVTLLSCPNIETPAGLANEAARADRSDLLVFLSSEVVVMDPSWIEELGGWFQKPEIGAVGGKITDQRGKTCQAGYLQADDGWSPIFSGAHEYFGCFGSSEWYRNFQAVSGGFMMVRREAFDRIGGFDEVGADEDPGIRLCSKMIQTGYRVLVDPFARVKWKPSPKQAGSETTRSPSSHNISLGSDETIADKYFNRNLFLQNHIPRIKTNSKA